MSRLEPKFSLVKIIITIILSTSILLFSSCESDPIDQPTPQINEMLFQQTLNLFKEIHQFPGVTAAYVLPDGSTKTFAAGLADIDQNIVMEPDTRMLAGSIGKSFVAATILSLEQEGKLNLDDKIELWLGGESWFPQLHRGNEVTIRMLLNHSTGFYEDFENPVRVTEYLQQLTTLDFDPDDNSLPPLVKFALNHDPKFPPGEDHLYTDVNYLIAGLVIEKVVESTYYQEVIDRFLNPLDLVNTEPSKHRIIVNLANGYSLPDNIFGLPESTLDNGALVYNPGIEWTGGGLVSNVADLALWAQRFYGGNAMALPYLDELLDGIPRGNVGFYGLGVYIDQDELGTSYYHGGFMPGYRSHIVYYPEYQISIAIQVNRDYNVELRSFSKSLAEIVIDGLN